MLITACCPKCKKVEEWEYRGLAQCSDCASDRLPLETDDFRKGKLLNQCPVCGAAHLYRQKDFNRKIGVLMVILGVAGAYWTYGLSLVAVAVIDLVIYRSVGDVGCCYLCEAQFRRTPMVGRLKPFNLELYDYYRNLKQRSAEGATQ